MKMKQLIGIAVFAVAMLAVAGVQAEEFDTLQGVSAVEMSDAQLAEVEGKNHIIRLVLQQTGKDVLPTDAAANATDAAGSIGGVGQDRPNIVGRLLN
jgi:hypothetical protein